MQNVQIQKEATLAPVYLGLLEMELFVLVGTAVCVVVSATRLGIAKASNTV